MFARIVYAKLRDVPLAEKTAAMETVVAAFKQEAGFVAAYYFAGQEDKETLVSISLWQTREDLLNALSQPAVQNAHKAWGMLLAAPSTNHIVPVAAHS